MVVRVKDHVSACDTNAQGDHIRAAILGLLQTAGTAEVSFAGVSNATSSFVNSAFVQLLEVYSFDDIKRRVRIVDAHRQIGTLIRSRMDFESGRMKMAA